MLLIFSSLLLVSAVSAQSGQCCSQQPYILETVEEILASIGGGGGGGITPEQYAYWQAILTSQMGNFLTVDGGTNYTVARLVDIVNDNLVYTSGQVDTQSNKIDYWNSYITSQLGQFLTTTISGNASVAHHLYYIRGATGAMSNTLVAMQDTDLYFNSYAASQLGNSLYALESAANKSIATLASLQVSLLRDIKAAITGSTGGDIPSLAEALPATLRYAMKPGQTPSTAPATQSLVNHFGNFPSAGIGKAMTNGAYGVKMAAAHMGWGFGIQSVWYSTTESGGHIMCTETTGCPTYTMSDSGLSNNEVVYDDSMNPMFYAKADTTFEQLIVFRNINVNSPLYNLRVFTPIVPSSLPASSTANCAPGDIGLKIDVKVLNAAVAPGFFTIMDGDHNELLLTTWINVGTEKHETGRIKLLHSIKSAAGMTMYCNGNPFNYITADWCHLTVCINPASVFTPSAILRQWIISAGSSWTALPQADTLFPTAGRGLIRTSIVPSTFGSLVPNVTVGVQPNPAGRPIPNQQGLQLEVELCYRPSTGDPFAVERGTIKVLPEGDHIEGILRSQYSLVSFNNWWLEELLFDRDMEYSEYSRKNYWPQIIATPGPPELFIVTTLDVDGCTTAVPRIPQAIWAPSLNIFMPIV